MAASGITIRMNSEMYGVFGSIASVWLMVLLAERRANIA
jgi:hypothetical protein